MGEVFFYRNVINNYYIEFTSFVEKKQDQNFNPNKGKYSSSFQVSHRVEMTIMQSKISLPLNTKF